MPSSLIIVALAAAWLVVLVPMIAKKRQQVARTADTALAARVVRSGSLSTKRRKEFAMSETKMRGHGHPAEDELDSAEPVDDVTEDDEPVGVDDEEFVDEEPMRNAEPQRVGVDGDARRYRPGRGGFDPEAAEIAARAKYAFRQRVVLGLLISVVLTIVLAAFVWSALWWVNGVADIALVGYLGYLRRQVRIENEIRQRRLTRLRSTRGSGRESSVSLSSFEAEPSPDDSYRDDTTDDEVEIDEVAESPREYVTPLRRPERPKVSDQAVVVDLDDEDPAFHELDEPGQFSFRRAAGE